jgi:hypothetical protein
MTIAILVVLVCIGLILLLDDNLRYRPVRALRRRRELREARRRYEASA